MNEVQSIENLYSKASGIVRESRKSLVREVNTRLAIEYFQLGQLIVEEEQSGDEKAGYGKELIKNLSKELTAEFGRGYSASTLKDARQFYLVFGKSQTLSGEFKPRLGFSHYVSLMRLEKEERDFYEELAVKEGYKVRELRRAISSNLMLRTIQSNKDGVAGKDKDAQWIIKDPYVAEYLGLKSYGSGDESKIEQGLIDNLQEFMIELGKGFAFVGRQYRLNIEGDTFYSDLVFYNIPLKRYVIFEIKTEKAKHQDLGQLQMYVNYFDREICDEGDNETIGILLCKDKNQSVIDYTLPEGNTTIFASRLKLYLPTKEELLDVIDGGDSDV